MRNRTLWLSNALLLLTGACVEDLQPRDEDDGIIGGGDGKVITTKDEDGSYRTAFDATATDGWAQLDFDLGVESIAPDESWDLGAQRFHLRLHEGAAGVGGSQVMALGDVPLENVTAPSSSGTWLVDQPDGDDENSTPDYAFEQGAGWYDYDSATHVLTPYPMTWLLRTGDGALRALRIESYYDTAGTSGRFKLRWRPVRASSTVTDTATATAAAETMR
jgi:HmuY protein